MNAWPVRERPIETTCLEQTPIPRILLAEDDPPMRELLASVLEAGGYEVVSLENGGSLLHTAMSLASDAVLADPPDLIVSDQRMPVATGLAVLKNLRDAQLPTPFILITGFGDPSTHAEARRLGATYVLDKPFSLDALMDAVRHLLTGDTMETAR